VDRIEALDEECGNDAAVRQGWMIVGATVASSVSPKPRQSSPVMGEPRRLALVAVGVVLDAVGVVTNPLEFR